MSNGNSSGNNSSSLWAAFLFGLTLLFIALKLTGFIAWSWLWVLSPIWVPSAIIVFLLILLLTISGLMTWRKEK